MNDLGFKSPTDRMCGNTGEVVYDDGLGVERVGIASIRALNADTLDDLLVSFGKKEPEFEQAEDAEDVEGAEVEGLD